ncbi:MAG: hypothetical protein QXJ72_06865 [Thermoproteota archaeon]
MKDKVVVLISVYFLLSGGFILTATLLFLLFPEIFATTLSLLQLALLMVYGMAELFAGYFLYQHSPIGWGLSLILIGLDIANLLLNLGSEYLLLTLPSLALEVVIVSYLLFKSNLFFKSGLPFMREKMPTPGEMLTKHTFIHYTPKKFVTKITDTDLRRFIKKKH